MSPHVTIGRVRASHVDEGIKCTVTVIRGLAYACGFGEPVDLIRAHKWFNIAAMLGNVRAREERAEIAELMTPLEIAEAQRLAREWVLTSM